MTINSFFAKLLYYLRSVPESTPIRNISTDERAIFSGLSHGNINGIMSPSDGGGLVRWEQIVFISAINLCCNQRNRYQISFPKGQPLLEPAVLSREEDY